MKTINHFLFVVDMSGSMSPVSNRVIDILSQQMALLRESSAKNNQEARVSIFYFNRDIKCVQYDTDISNVKINELEQEYRASGNTNLWGSVKKSLVEQQLYPTIYGNHAFIAYFLTDGQDTEKQSRPSEIRSLVNALSNDKSEWVFCAFCPKNSVDDFAACGFSRGNIIDWSDIKHVASSIKQGTETFISNRTAGIRTNSIFTAPKLEKSDISLMVPLKPKPKSYKVTKESYISDFCMAYHGSYTKGCAYYELTKKSKVQDYKEFLVRDNSNGNIYGGDNARQIVVGYTNGTVVLAPSNDKRYSVFVQSTSFNRKLVPNTLLLVVS